MAGLSIGWWVLILLGGISLFVFFGNNILKLVKVTGIGVLKIAIGLMILFFFNIFGQLISFQLPINLITGLTVGILGIPGLITLILIKVLFI